MNTEILNGHAGSSGVTEKVKVDIETPDKVPEVKAELATVSEQTEGKAILEVPQYVGPCVQI